MPLDASSATLKVSGFDEYFSRGYRYEVSYSGSRTELGITNVPFDFIRIFDPKGKDVTNLFKINRNNGKIHIYDREVTFRSPDCTKVYDGVLPETGSLFSGVLKKGHEYVVVQNMGTSVGSYYNKFDVKIIDTASGADVSSHYKINKNFGSVKISALAISIKPVDMEKAYDGTELVADEVTIIQGALINGHRIDRFVISGSQTNVGRSESYVSSVVIVDENGNDVTANYQIELKVGKLKVRPS